MHNESSDSFHDPVLTAESLECLRPALETGELLVDCTVGGGGHSEVFLDAFSHVALLGIDRDSDALAVAARRLERFGSRVELAKGNFSQLEQLLTKRRLKDAAAVFYDLGVSSFQLDTPQRGFQYRWGASIDMRMDAESGETAGDIVNNYSSSDLKRILNEYGEERFADRVANAIVKRRREENFDDAGDLAEVVKAAIPAATRRTGPHPARRSFQALRIAVNNELGSLKQSLASALSLLAPGGGLAAISYHSLEDRIVKSAFTEAAIGCICPRGLPVCLCGGVEQVRILTRKPIKPGDDEISRNPRARSASLRAAEKLGGQGSRGHTAVGGSA
ncbi:MAG: 16S rRNA (cytosine(1402)-N(4))-methyltransferase RsmH [Actinomycetota bacterium]